MMKKISLILFCIFYCSSCSLVISKVANIKDINHTTGMYDIGTKRLLLIDSTRTNWFLDDYHHEKRKLMTQIWYPANSIR